MEPRRETGSATEGRFCHFSPQRAIGNATLTSGAFPFPSDCPQQILGETGSAPEVRFCLFSAQRATGKATLSSKASPFLQPWCFPRRTKRPTWLSGSRAHAPTHAIPTTGAEHLAVGEWQEGGGEEGDKGQGQ